MNRTKSAKQLLLHYIKLGIDGSVSHEMASEIEDIVDLIQAPLLEEIRSLHERVEMLEREVQ